MGRDQWKQAMGQEFNAYHPPTQPTNQPTTTTIIIITHSLTHHHHSDLLKGIKGVEEGPGGENNPCRNLASFVYGDSPSCETTKSTKWQSGPQEEAEFGQWPVTQRLWHKSLMPTTHPPNQPTNQPPPPPSSSSLTHSPPPPLRFIKRH